MCSENADDVCFLICGSVFQVLSNEHILLLQLEKKMLF